MPKAASQNASSPQTCFEIADAATRLPLIDSSSLV